MRRLISPGEPAATPVHPDLQVSRHGMRPEEGRIIQGTGTAVETLGHCLLVGLPRHPVLVSVVGTPIIDLLTRHVLDKAIDRAIRLAATTAYETVREVPTAWPAAAGWHAESARSARS